MGRPFRRFRANELERSSRLGLNHREPRGDIGALDRLDLVGEPLLEFARKGQPREAHDPELARAFELLLGLRHLGTSGDSFGGVIEVGRACSLVVRRGVGHLAEPVIEPRPLLEPEKQVVEPPCRLAI